MRSPAIQKLIDVVEADYGAVKLYGSEVSEKHGACFIVKNVCATFSAHTQDGTLPAGEYDIQIEGIPPGDYIYTSVVTLDGFLELLQQMHGPNSDWPST